MKYLHLLFVLAVLVLNACSSSDDMSEQPQPETENSDFKMLSLGDSYTIGESVCNSCRFPVQLQERLVQTYEPASDFGLKIIARTGWTTSNLIAAVNNENLSSDYDLVTLLIGVNNQYQGKAFSLYESEFPKLVATAVAAANNNKNRVVVLSIPDYAFTPFGQANNPQSISQDIDRYNDFAKNYCDSQSITFLDITDITRDGLNNPDLVASDGLHPSALAYTKFVDRLLPIALEKL